MAIGLLLAASGCHKKYTEEVKGATWIGVFELVAHDAAGHELWRETIHNALADEGEEAFLDVFLRGATAPATFYLRLYNDTPAETDGLADLTGEPSGNGYAAEELARSAVGWPTLALDSGDYQATSATVTYTASGGSIGPVTYCVLATTSDNTGLLVSYAALSQSRTLADGESLDVTYRIKLQ
jgi:hypothetical protein